MTAALEGGEWSAARLDRTLPPGKNRYPFYRRMGGSHGLSGRAENLVPTGIRSRTVQPVVSRIYIYIIYIYIGVTPMNLTRKKSTYKSSNCKHKLYSRYKKSR